MTIRETITNLLRIPTDARAVVEMARENVEKHRETYALETTLIRKVESLESLSGHLREQLDTSEEEAKRFLTERDAARNELGPTQALVSEYRRQLESCSARIRALETHLAEVEAIRDSLADAINADKKPTIADLWRPIGDEEWRSMLGDASVLVRGGTGSEFVTCTRVSARGDRTHYIPLEPPR